MNNSNHFPITSLQRIFDEFHCEDNGLKHQIENAAVAFFQQKVVEAGVIDKSPSPDDFFGWLSLMRHYGAATRFTDWTVDLWIALYFAFDKITSENMVKVYVLNGAFCKLQMGFSEDKHDQSNEHLKQMIKSRIHWPFPLVIPEPDKRMTNQKALFVADCGLDNSVQQLFDKGGALYWEQANNIMINGRIFTGGQPAYSDRQLGLIAAPADLFMSQFNIPTSLEPAVREELIAKGITRDYLYGTETRNDTLKDISRQTNEYIRQTAKEAGASPASDN